LTNATFYASVPVITHNEQNGRVLSSKKEPKKGNICLLNDCLIQVYRQGVIYEIGFLEGSHKKAPKGWASLGAFLIEP